MTLVVIDTGVLVSGIYWRHEPHQCVQAWLRGVVTLVVSDAICEEYERVLLQVKAEQRFATDLEPWLAAIRQSALWITPEPLAGPVCRDPKDDKFLEAALSAGARLLIARDADLTDLEKPFGVEVVTPRQFLARLPRRIRRQLE
jgi:putative PIN family toxin of toxin-antitoxin system